MFALGSIYTSSVFMIILHIKKDKERNIKGYQIDIRVRTGRSESDYSSQSTRSIWIELIYYIKRKKYGSLDSFGHP